MSIRTDVHTLFVLLLLSLDATRCFDLHQTVAKLNEILPRSSSRRLRETREYEETSLMWQEYEFGSETSNREELVVTNISVHPVLSENKTNWQFLEASDAVYLAGAENTEFSLYSLNPDGTLIKKVSLKIEGRILTFKLISYEVETSAVDVKSHVVIVLCVQSKRDTFLQWFRLLDNDLKLLFLWPVQKHVADLEFARHESQNTLLLLDNDAFYFGKYFSPIDIYGFVIDFENNNVHIWLYQRISMPKVFDIHVCSVHENTIIALQGLHSVFLFEYRNTNTMGIFKEFQTIKSQNLRNLACFESGYIRYLAISGSEAGLFSFKENEYQFNTESERYFNEVPEISWVQDIRVDTYRDESLLLMQLKNATVIALSWRGMGFRKVSLPNRILDKFDLSKVTVIPKFGFIYNNMFVRIQTNLSNLPDPAQEKTASMLKTQILLNEMLSKQERIIDETERLLNQSYLKNHVVTGIWNLSKVESSNVTVKDEVILPLVNNTINFISNYANTKVKLLKNLEANLVEIEENLKNSWNIDQSDIDLGSDVTIDGNLIIKKSLHVENFTVDFINNVSKTNLLRDLYGANSDIIEGRKIFPSIQAKSLTIHTLNGIPIKNILLDASKKDYSHVNFSNVNRMVIDEHLKFSSINNVDWQQLMQNIVWKNEATDIPGNTVVDGEIVADDVRVDVFNSLNYPDDYILRNSTTSAEVVGSKSFNKLSVATLLGIDTINGVNIEDYVVLSNNVTLDREITFENLILDGMFLIDGNITGIDMNQSFSEKLLNETNRINSDIIISNLTVLGDIFVADSIGEKTWADFDDLLLKSDNDTKITGNKTFLSGVNIASNITIKSNIINGHPVEEFVTLDTKQELRNLERIKANVAFRNVTYGSVKKLEEFLNNATKQNGSFNCLEKIILFNNSVEVDEFLFNTLNENISGELFQEKLNHTFQRVHFENLTVETLLVRELIPAIVNNINISDFEQRRLTFSTPQNLTGDYSIDVLYTEILNARSMNGMSMEDLNSLEKHFDKLQSDIFHGNVSLKSLQVTGEVNATSLNGIKFQDIYKNERMVDVILNDDVFIENLTVLGLMNGVNFSEFVSDAVLKTDRNITVTGYKQFQKINCQMLETLFLNGHSIENIFDTNKEQVLQGPVTVHGSVYVIRNFDTDGRIDDIYFHDFTKRYKILNDNTRELFGDFKFSSNATVKNLYIDGSIRKLPMNTFLKSLIFKNESNVTIFGSKTFQNFITFNGSLTISENWNNLSLKNFYEKAVFTDRSFSIDSEIVFKEDVAIRKNLIVKTSFETKTIKGIDVDELEDSVMYLNRSMYIPAHITFTDVFFESGIHVENLNGLDMNLIIPLHTEQPINVERLKGINVTVENIDVMKGINGYDLDEIYNNTFMKIGDQIITGNITFSKNVYARRDFDANLINGIDFKKIIPLDTNDTLIGNFVFEEPLVLNGSLRVLKYFNGIQPIRWQEVAVMTNLPRKQIVSGKWIVHGNVRFENGAVGSAILNGVNVKELADALEKINLEMDARIADIDMNLDSMCKDLSILKKSAQNQIYKFNTFEYLQIFDFDRDISSVHYFELEDMDYLMISYDTCHMDVFVYTEISFTLVASVNNFGSVNEWTTFRSKNALYFLTIGTHGCQRSTGNLWKLENNEFTHILDLENVTDAKKIDENTFLMLANDNLEKQVIGTLYRESLGAVPSFSSHDTPFKFVSNSERILLGGRNSVYEYDKQSLNRTRYWENCFGCTRILSFKVGIFEEEIFLYYNEEVNKDYIFICNNDVGQKKVLQTIRAHRPKSFLVLNFEGSVEALLIFVENGKRLQVYEYQGVLGFVHKDIIQLEADKLFNFKIRKYSNFAKRHCLALIRKNRLTILEAKMYGEKLDMETPSCSRY